MIRSMTGFGEGKTVENGVTSVAVVKCTNHRYLKVRVKGLSGNEKLQQRVEKMIKSHFDRGRIHVQIEVEGGGEQPGPLVPLDRVRKDLDTLSQVVDELNMNDNPNLDHLIALGSFDSAQFLGDRYWEIIRSSLREAIEELKDDQAEEGRALERDLRSYLDNLENLVDSIEARMPDVVERRKQKLKDRVEELLEDFDFPQNDQLEREVAILADKVDVSEEIARLRTHLNEARNALEGQGSAGKRLSFLAQELKRETNTVGAKCKDGDLQSMAVDMKVEIEKFNEQVRNIE